MTRHAVGHAAHRAVSEVCDPENLNKSNNNKSLKRRPVCPTPRCCCQADGLQETENQTNSPAASLTSLLSPVNPASSISSFPVLLLSFLFEAQTSESFLFTFIIHRFNNGKADFLKQTAQLSLCSSQRLQVPVSQTPRESPSRLSYFELPGSKLQSQRGEILHPSQCADTGLQAISLTDAAELQSCRERVHIQAHGRKTRFPGRSVQARSCSATPSGHTYETRTYN